MQKENEGYTKKAKNRATHYLNAGAELLMYLSSLDIEIIRKSISKIIDQTVCWRMQILIKNCVN